MAKQTDDKLKKYNDTLRKKSEKTYEKAKFCPKCNTRMKYNFGETFECENCGYKELTEFGKVREFLEKMGPQPATVISQETGVQVYIIEAFLRQGRVEIPEGSSIYIKCQSCGEDIRYGRFCPECALKMTNSIGQAMLMPEVGEKPKTKTGRMHIMEDNDLLRQRTKGKR